MRTVQEHPQFHGIKPLEKQTAVTLQFVLDGQLGRVGLPFAQFQHDPQVLDLFRGRSYRIQFAAGGISLLDELLSLFPVVPEGVSRH